MATGRFICFEGGEGAGKSSALVHVADHLWQLGHRVVMTREPGGTPEGTALRALLLASDGPAWEPAAEHLLMAAARIQHVQRVIRPAMAEGAIVICDRFVASTLAYQGAGRGLSADFILKVHAQTTGDLWPDLTLVFDVDPAIGLARSRKRLSDTALDEGRFEGVERDFHDRVRQSFLAQAAEAPERHVVIDAGGPQADVLARAIKAIADRL
jgi:dTMP kinase